MQEATNNPTRKTRQTPEVVRLGAENTQTGKFSSVSEGKSHILPASTSVSYYQYSV